jgi:phage gpG-like protein
MLPQSINSEDLEAELSRWAQSIELENLGRALLETGTIVREDFNDHFVQAQGPDGAWPPRKYQYPWPILIKTGKLKETATTEGAPGNIARFRAGFAEFGLDVSVVNYAGFHEYGTSKLPPRPWAWLSSEAEEAAANAFADAVYRLLVDPTHGPSV